MATEFWGVEVKHGESVHVDPGEDMIVHISQAALGENKNNGNDSIRLYLKVGDQKLTIGVLSHEKFPHMSTEIVLERGFELSHSWKNGSVYFSGYKVDASDPEADYITDDKLAVAGDKEVVSVESGTKQVNFQLPNDDVKATQDDSDDSNEESEDAGDEKEKKAIAEGDSSDDEEDDSSDEEEDDSSEDDEDDSSEEETPKKKPEESKKRSAEANTSKNTASNKKAKFVTPQKTTETKKPYVHIATPYPSKQASKGPGSSNGEASKQQQQTPKSAGAFGCKSCKRTFTTEMGLQSHTKAKHSAAA